MKRAWLCLTAIAVCGSAHAQDWAKEKLEKSPRHHEYVKVKNGAREVNCFVAYPEVKDKATAVLVIHEIFGLADWPKLLADELAEAGYIAIVPDLLSGMGANGGGTEAFDRDGVMRAIRDLKSEQVDGDLDAAAKYVAALPACNGKVAVCGFCWGGGHAFRYATHNRDVKGAFAFYGALPLTKEQVERINCPVYGFYGGNDNRINSQIPAAESLMKEAGKTYEPIIYESGGHGFMRQGNAPDAREGDIKARAEAWTRWKEILKKL